MQFSLEQLLVDFETAFGCKVTLHDPMHLLKSIPDILSLPECRISHRMTFPTMCGRESRKYCIEHCFLYFIKWTEKSRRPLYFIHCKNGFWQLAVNIYRNNVHVLTMFAGLWRRFDDKEAIRRLARMFPIFADGFYQVIEKEMTNKMRSIHSLTGRIQAFIASNYNRPLQTRELARHLSLSVSRTCAIVQRECHACFKELLARERIRHAKMYLEQSELRIKEIALLCGFASSEHFLRTFRAFENMTPLEWRESARQTP